MAGPRRLDVLDMSLAAIGLAGNYTGPWIPTDGIEQVVGHWFSAGGATITATIDESIDGTTADSSQSLGAAGAAGPTTPVVVRVRTPYIRVKFVDSVAAATTFRGCLKAT